MAKQNDYYSLKNILRKGADYNLIYGERSNGKSYAVKEYVLKRFFDTGEQFVYMRRYDRDITRGLADGYFSDMPIEKFSKGKYNIIYTHAGGVYVAYQDPETGKRINIAQCGFVRCLALAQRYSSTAYPHVTTIILEEFISLDGTYLPNEIMLFRHIISTVARRRNIKVFMVANTISRLSPYFREFGVVNINTQAQGTIDLYTMQGENGDTLIACEYCANTAARSKMFFGADKSMTNEGKWLVKDYPKLERPREQWECLAQFVVEFNDTRFLVEYLMSFDNVLIDDTFFCLYVTPKTTPVKKGTVVYSNIVTSNPFYRRGLEGASQREDLILSLIDTKTFYCDNLTGTEFNEVVKKLRLL